MSTEPLKSLSQVVEEYFATATPEQLEKDIRDSDFDKYNGVGEVILSVDEWIEKIRHNEQLARNIIPSRLFRGRKGQRKYKYL